MKTEFLKLFFKINKWTLAIFRSKRLLSIGIIAVLLFTSQVRATDYKITIEGDQIYLNGPKGKKNFQVLGLRVSNALKSDKKVDELINNMDTFKSYGINSLSVFFMGSRFGDIKGYNPDGSLNDTYKNRMGKIIEAADDRGMVILVGCLYWSTSSAKEDLKHWGQTEANKAVANTVKWLSENDYRNVLVDIDNEGMAFRGAGFKIGPMIDAGHAVDPTIMLGNNLKPEFGEGAKSTNEDFNCHFGPKETGKPYFDSEVTFGGYWGDYSKKDFNNTNGEFYNYSRIGAYNSSGKDKLRKKSTFSDRNGAMFASTWLQCGNGAGIDGPFMRPGGDSNISNINNNTDELHPDAGIKWWLEWAENTYGAWNPDPEDESGEGLLVKKNNFTFDNKPFDMWGVRVASASLKKSYTDQLISQLDNYKSYGINTVTVFYQGSSGGSGDPFSTDGKSFANKTIRDNMDEIIEACAKKNMVVIVGIFYQMTKGGGTPKLKDWNASKEAVKTVVKHLKAKNHKNVILNIANEQNSGGYTGLPWERVNNTSDLLDMVKIANQQWPELIVGCGGYDHDKNEAFLESQFLDVLLFDTINLQNSEDLFDRFKKASDNRKIPMVNVEMFGGWTKRFVDPPGNCDKVSGREEHLKEANRALRNDGLYMFFHSNPWFQGLSVQDGKTRFDLGGKGTKSDPGVKWYFEHIQSILSDSESDDGKGYFNEKGGLLVMEAENFEKKFDRTPTNGTQKKEHSWTKETANSGFSGSGYMGNLPDEQCESCPEHNSPKDGSGAEMVYRVKINTEGTYKVWMRGRSLGGESNGVHIQIDDKFVIRSAGTNMSGFRPHKKWIWENKHKEYAAAPKIFLSKGMHTIHVYGRDDGFRLDKILLGINQNSAPSGQGPEESEFVDGDVAENTPPSLKFLNPLDNAQFEEGTDLEVVVEAKDADGSIKYVDLYLNNVFVSRENNPPYDWPQKEALKNLKKGNYTLKAITEDNDGEKTENSITIKIGSSDTDNELNGKVVTLQANNKKYVSSENGLKPMTANRSSVGKWERFTIIDNNNDGIVALRGNNGKYVSSENGQKPMNCNRNEIGSQEKFEWIDLGDGKVALKGNNNKYVSSENGQKAMTCNRSAIGGWETFNYKVIDDKSFEDINQNSLIIYPNPLPKDESVLRISVEGADTNNKAILRIFNSLGQQVIQEELEGSELLIDVGQLNPGVYFLSYKSLGEGKITKTFIKQ